MRRLFLALVVSTALFVPAAEAKRVALVIGNSDYEFVTDLVNPVNDANLMEATLKDAGFDVIRLDNLDQRGMKLAMVEFSRKLKQGAEASMFYYAGHGLEVEGRNFLVPTDSNTQSKEEADIHNVEVNSFLSLMENSGVPLNIVVLDACRNNPFRGMRAVGGGLAPVRAPVGTYVAYATAPGSVASDGFGSNSPFTQALSESIKVPGLTLEAVFKQTRTKVRAATGGEQVPFDSSAIEGDFYFVGGPQQQPAVEQQVAAIEPKQDVLPSKTDPPTQVTISRGDDGQTAFEAAGSDLDMLRVVAGEYSGTVWGKLAAARVKVLESQQALLQTPPQADPPAEDTPPPPVVESPPPVETGPPAIRLNAEGTGDYKTIAEAIAAAKSGERIELAPGTYSGGVIVEKPVEIVGTGSFEHVIWRVEGADVIQWKAESGLIKNLTLLQAGGCEKTCNAIYFANGSAVVENSALTSQGGATIYVQGVNAQPKIIKNNVHGAKEGGIYLESEAGGSIEFNDIYANTFAGIEIKSGANPLVKGNLVRDGKQGGIFVNTDGKGIIEENDIYGNGYAGIEIKDGADPVVRNNKVYNQLQSGIFVNLRGRGNIVNNDIYGNAQANVNIAEQGDPTISGNRVYDGKEGGFFIEKGGKGVIEGNDIYGNTFAGVEIRDASTPVVRKNTIRNGKQGGVFVHEEGKGLIEDNEIINNGFSGIEVKGRGNPVVKSNRITGNGENGIYIYDKGLGTYTDNELSTNTKGAWRIEKTAGKVKRSGNQE